MDGVNFKLKKTPIESNLHLNKNEYSIASSIPDPIDASQILRRENSYKMNVLDSS